MQWGDEMRLEQLGYLIEVSKHKSLNSASKALHMTPQALSMSIKQLESELGFQVLYRSAVGAALTPEGKATAVSALNFIEHLKAIKSSTEKPPEQLLPAEMTLMMPSGSADSYMPSFQVLLYKMCPKCRMAIQEASYQEIIQSVLEEKVEIALTAQLTIDGRDALGDIPPELEFVPFLNYRLCCYGHAHFPVTRYKMITLKSMFEYPVILFEPARYIFQHVIAAACPAENANIIWVSKTAMVNEFLKNGLGLGFAFINEKDRRFLIDMPQGVAVPLKESLLIHYGSLIKRQKKLTEGSSHLAEYLRIFFNQ